MFYTLDSGDYHEWRILKYDELEGYFEETISKIRNFNTQRLNDELAKNINELDNNLKTIRLMLRERPQMIDENSGLFPEDFKCYRSKLLRDGDDKWANGVLCGFMAVASWANGLIGEVCTILDELSELVQADVETNNDGNKLPNKEQEKVTESSSITRKKSTRKEKIYNFSDIIQYHDKKELLERLHFLIDGRGGAAVGAVIQKAKMDGYLTRYPYEGDFRQEFEVKGSWNAISNYFNEDDNKCLAKSADVIIFKDKISN